MQREKWATKNATDNLFQDKTLFVLKSQGSQGSTLYNWWIQDMLITIYKWVNYNSFLNI